MGFLVEGLEVERSNCKDRNHRRLGHTPLFLVEAEVEGPRVACLPMAAREVVAD